MNGRRKLVGGKHIVAKEAEHLFCFGGETGELLPARRAHRGILAHRANAHDGGETKVLVVFLQILRQLIGGILGPCHPAAVDRHVVLEHVVAARKAAHMIFVLVGGNQRVKMAIGRLADAFDDG
jgi:hypothetical protein